MTQHLESLRDACNFVEVAAAVCEIGRRLGVLHGTVFLTTPMAKPLISVDNMLDVDDDDRLARFRETWALAPRFRELVRNHAPVGDTRTLLVPLIGRDGLLGAIQFDNESRLGQVQKRDLGVLGHHASVRLAYLRVNGTVESPFDRLTPKRREVARCCVAHVRWSNQDIADELKRDVNTVKKHLKDVYDELDVTSREELRRLWENEPPCEIEPGVRRAGDVVVARP